MTTDNAILLGIMEQNPGYKIAGSTLYNRTIWYCHQQGQDGLNEVNQAIDDMVADGTYQKSMQMVW